MNYIERALPEITHHPMPNIIDNFRLHGEKYTSFVEYPSVKVMFHNTDEVLDLLNQLDAKCIFVDGDGISLIIPSYYSCLIDWLKINFDGSVTDDCYGKEFEYVTLAIKAGLNGQIVELGHSIFGYAGTAQEMLDLALKFPERAIDEWINLYERSMILI